MPAITKTSDGHATNPQPQQAQQKRANRRAALKPTNNVTHLIGPWRVFLIAGDEARMSTNTHPQPPSNTSCTTAFSPPPPATLPSSPPPPPPFAASTSSPPFPSPLSPPSLAAPPADPLPLEPFPLPPPPLPPPPLRPPPRPPLEPPFSVPRRCCPPPLPPPPPPPPPERDKARRICCCFSRSLFMSVSHLISATYERGAAATSSTHVSDGNDEKWLWKTQEERPPSSHLLHPVQGSETTNTFKV